MIREVVKIDEDLCDGCGNCIPECQEGALRLIDGKARLVSDVLCDGLGACLGHCPRGAITIEKREAEAFDEIKVMEQSKEPLACGCPGSETRSFVPGSLAAGGTLTATHEQDSQLAQWPVQMHLINPSASFFQGSDLLLAADCVAFSLGNFHSIWLKGKSLAIACPKLDTGLDSYIAKIRALIDEAKINTLTVMMMQVPCCGGLLQLVNQATAGAKRKVPVKSVIVSAGGRS